MLYILPFVQTVGIWLCKHKHICSEKMQPPPLGTMLKVFTSYQTFNMYSLQTLDLVPAKHVTENIIMRYFSKLFFFSIRALRTLRDLNSPGQPLWGLLPTCSTNELRSPI